MKMNKLGKKEKNTGMKLPKLLKSKKKEIKLSKILGG